MDKVPQTRRDWRNYIQERAYAAWKGDRDFQATPARTFADLVAEAEDQAAASAAAWRKAFEAAVPKEYLRRLEDMPATKRDQRLTWIRERVDLAHIDMLVQSLSNPLKIAEKAAEIAIDEAERQWALGGEKTDAEGCWVLPTDPSSRRLRDRRTHSRRLRQQLRKTDLFLSAACGAVSRTIGAEYASGFTLARYIADQKAKAAIMEKLILVRKDNPEIQLSMSEIAAKSATQAEAQLRLLLDAEAVRGQVNRMYLCWITITLPGRYVPRALDDDKRVAAWDPDCDLLAGDMHIQKLWSQIRAIAAKQNLEMSGVWGPQAQHSGTQHRHKALWAHSLEEARAFCDVVRRKMNQGKDSTSKEETKNSHAVQAFVVEDTDPRYAPPERKDTKEDETVESVFRYLSRYTTRENGAIDIDTTEPEKLKKLRHQAIAAGRFRSFAFIGTSATASGIWKTCYRAMMRVEDGENPGICIRSRNAILHMRKADQHGKAASLARASIGILTEEIESGELSEPQLRAARKCLQEEEMKLRVAKKHAACHAYLAGLALGRWKAMTPIEKRYIERKFGRKKATIGEDGAVRVEKVGTYPAPVAAYEATANRYDEPVKKFIGIRSGDTGREECHCAPIVLRLTEHDWEIIDRDEHHKRIEIALQIEAAKREAARVVRRAELLEREIYLRARDAFTPLDVFVKHVEQGGKRDYVSFAEDRYVAFLKTQGVTVIPTCPRPEPSAPAGTAALPPKEAAAPPGDPPGHTLAA